MSDLQTNIVESYDQLQNSIEDSEQKSNCIAALKRITEYFENIKIESLEADDTAGGTRTAVHQIHQMTQRLNKRLLQIVITQEEFAQLEPWIERYSNAIDRFNQMTNKIIAGLEQFENLGPSGSKN